MDFVKAYENMPYEARNSILKTVFLCDDSDYSEKIREEYFREKLKFCGKNVKFGRNVRIINPEYVSIGDDAFISDDVTIISRKGNVTIGDRTVIKERVLLDTEQSKGYITIGSDAYIGTGTTLFGHLGLEIGDFCLLAQNITLTPYSHIFEDPNTEIIKQGGHCKKVTIGRDTYIGMGVTVMYSGDIGEGCIIGAGSNVVKPIPDFSVAVGNPAKVIRRRDNRQD